MKDPDRNGGTTEEIEDNFNSASYFLVPLWASECGWEVKGEKEPCCGNISERNIAYWLRSDISVVASHRRFRRPPAARIVSAPPVGFQIEASILLHDPERKELLDHVK